MVTETYLKPTYLPTYLPTYVTVITVAIVVTVVTVVSSEKNHATFPYTKNHANSSQNNSSNL